jgi:ComF family protein
MSLSILNQLFPIQCLVCQQESQRYLCESCLAKIQKTLLPNHFFISSLGEMIFGYSHYAGPAGKIIRVLKYGKKTPGASVIAELLAPIIQKLIQPDIIIPVPISWQKKWSRGFNQCSLIAQELKKITHIPCCETILTRKFSWIERDQVRLSATERKNNLNNTFIAKRNNHYSRSLKVLLLDDVATTGKTIYTCQKALRNMFPAWTINSIVFAHN